MCLFQVNLTGLDTAFAEVEFYFELSTMEGDVTVALVSFYSSPSQQLLDESYNTLISCTSLGDAGLKVIPVKSITAVIAMVPHAPFGVERYFVVEKPGLDVTTLGGAGEDDIPDE